MAGLIFEFLWRAYSLRRGRAHTIRAKTMKQYWINLQEYLALCKYMPTLLRAAKSAHELPVKSVVVCSTDNFESLQQLGVVLQAGDEVLTLLHLVSMRSMRTGKKGRCSSSHLIK